MADKGANLSFEIVFPVYNEEKDLENSVVRVHDYLKQRFSCEWYITIADNASTDRTPIIGKDLEARYGNVKYLRLAEKGVGRALKYAWNQSQCSIIGYMDVDLSTDIGHLPEALSVVSQEKADIAIGTRLHPRSRVEKRKLLREASSRTFNFLLRKYLKVKFSDAICGFKFLKRSVFLDLQKVGIENNEWFFDAELLIQAERLNYKIFEIPVHWIDTEDSKVDIIDTSIKYLKEIVRMKRGMKNEG
jgi:glycosyltransferase involved in cell wall biosynthesis